MKEKFVVTELLLMVMPGSAPLHYKGFVCNIANTGVYSGKVHDTYDKALDEIKTINLRGRSFQIQKIFIFD